MTKQNLSITERFMKYVQKSDSPDECWEWIGANNGNGYGKFSIDNKMFFAHRVSYMLFVGHIPDGMLVCHSCDNEKCVNPSHLWLGTNRDNTNDKMKKNRQSHHTGVKGENHWSHKLTEQNIYQIREMIEQGYTHQIIADFFRIDKTTISCIKRGKSWGWLK